MLKEAGADAMFVKTDVSRRADVEVMVAKAAEKYGRLDCAFNNAGIEGEGGQTHECTEANRNRVIAINLTGVWLCMKAEIAQMLKQCGSGAIVNTSSGAGLAGIRGMPAYVAAKHGVAGLTRAAALEYGRHNLRINAVCPGPIRTPMMTRGLQRRVLLTPWARMTFFGTLRAMTRENLKFTCSKAMLRWPDQKPAS